MHPLCCRSATTQATLADPNNPLTSVDTPGCQTERKYYHSAVGHVVHNQPVFLIMLASNPFSDPQLCMDADEQA